MRDDPIDADLRDRRNRRIEKLAKAQQMGNRADQALELLEMIFADQREEYIDELIGKLRTEGRIHEPAVYGLKALVDIRENLVQARKHGRTATVKLKAMEQETPIDE